MDEQRPTTVSVGPATAEDIPSIRSLARDSGMFAPEDLAVLSGMLQDQLDGVAIDARWLVARVAGAEFAGAAYLAPEPFADRVWNLYFLAVAHGHERSGVGTALVGEVVRGLERAGESVARVLLVETSSTEDFAAARAFYLREGFEREALIRDYYGPGDHKIVYWLSLVE